MLEICKIYNRKLQDDDTGIFEYAKIIDEKFYKRYKIDDADVGYINCTDSRIVPVKEALNGWFWDLMYGKDEKETNREL